MISNIRGKYTWLVNDRNGNLLADLTGIAQSRELSFSRNGTYQAKFKVDANIVESLARKLFVNIRSIFNIAQSQILVKRLNIPIYSGQMVYFDADYKDQKDFTVTVNGWTDILKDRFTAIDSVHTNEDQSDILWDEINYTQSLANGSLGITRGQHPVSISRNREYESKNIRDLMKEMTELTDGIDFEFSWDKKFNTFYPFMGVVHTDFLFTYPGGNIKEFKVTTDASKMINYNIARGAGTGDGQLLDILQDTTSQTNYGLKQAVSDYSDVLDMTSLDQEAQGDLNAYSSPLDQIQLIVDANKAPFFGSYWIGDFVNLQLFHTDLFAYVNGYYRINQLDLKIDGDDNEEVTIYLAKDPITFAKRTHF